MKRRPELAVPAFVLLLVAAIGWLWFDRQQERAAVEAHEEAQAEAFARLPLAQAVAHCRALWRQNHYDQAPLALAWQPGQLDWYVLKGIDTRSMQHFHCDGVRVERGARVPRVLLDRVPASDAAGSSADELNLFDHYASAAAALLPSLQALEAAVDPQQPAARTPLERQWVGGVPQFSHSTVAALPRLFAEPPPQLPPAPGPQPLPVHDWLKDPQAAFSLLGDHVPSDAQVARLDIGSDRLTVVILGSFPQDGGRGPAPFGEATFDEYGVRDTGWWYPRDHPSSGCALGRPLAEVRAAYLQHPQRDNPELLYATYGCGARQGIEPGGEWTLRLPQRRRR